MEPLQALFEQPERDMPSEGEILGTAEYLRKHTTGLDDELSIDASIIAAAIYQQTLKNERYRDTFDEQLAGIGKLLDSIDDAIRDVANQI